MRTGTNRPAAGWWPVPSPRQILLEAVAECLRQIRTEAGFQTDAGLTVTLEPGQVEDTADGVLGVLITKQERGAEPGLIKTHRLTTVVLLAKVPAAFDQAQARLDAIVSDVERAMDAQQARFPVGIQFPQYVSMEPAKPEAGMGWIGALLTYQNHIPIK